MILVACSSRTGLWTEIFSDELWKALAKPDYTLLRQELRVILGNRRNLRATFQTLRAAISSHEDASEAIRVHRPSVERV